MHFLKHQRLVVFKVDKNLTGKLSNYERGQSKSENVQAFVRVIRNLLL